MSKQIELTADDQKFLDVMKQGMPPQMDLGGGFRVALPRSPSQASGEGRAEVTQEMVYAAVKEAVAQGLVPRHAHGEDAYQKVHEQIAAVVRAALAAVNG
jgi:hypothetical protein